VCAQTLEGLKEMKDNIQPGAWIDISVPLYSGMVHWPDNPPVEIERTMSMDAGAVCNVSKLSMGAHTGTHMDAPIHFIRNGKAIDGMPLEATIGLVRVLEIADTESVKVNELQTHNIQPGERVLLKTINSQRCWQSDTFVEDFVYISHEAAQYLAERRVQTVGVDYLSVGGYSKDGPETHRALLSAGIWVIEGLNLSQVQPGSYQFICLPIKMVGSDGAPARAILRTA
jgi:arylformamidase